MTIEGPIREQISNSIKQYLYQFESYSKAIEEIMKLCTIPQSELEKLPGDMQKLKQEQMSISSKIIEVSTTLKDLIAQRSRNERKINGLYATVNDLKAKLLSIDEELKKKAKTVEHAKACNETGPELKNALSVQYKRVLEKLAAARKHFPDIYSEAEQETGIHFFTPIA
ncbi:MAG: hypothetical protein Q6353_000985 [Candidatus Sigynarchaeum springense]